MKRLHNVDDLRSALTGVSCVVLHSGCCEPPWFTEKLAQHAASFKGLRVYAFMPMGQAPYSDAAPASLLDVVCLFPGKGLRAALTAGRVTPMRASISELCQSFSAGKLPADAVMLQVSPPVDGFVSLGICVDILPAVLSLKPLIFAQINPRMPRTAGATLIPVSDIDYFVDCDSEIQEIATPASDETDEKIARNVASLLSDGAVLQLGIGTLPDSVLGQLGHLRHLGLHSGIVTDAILPLIEGGTIDNSTKTHMRGISVTAMAGGTRRLYDFLDGSTAIEFHSSTMVHSAEVLATIDRFHAINSALQVDLSGNVNGESVGRQKISMPGGMPDFASGACLSRGGMSIVALRASSKGCSNIVASLRKEGSPLTINCDLVDYVVTEHGVAQVRGTSPTVRAKAILAISEPAAMFSLASSA